jgi:beta-1,4-N-acetylglucosaminyltransferase
MNEAAALSPPTSTGFSLFATVGSTSFDELVRALTTEATLSALSLLGIGTITIQYGRGNALQEEQTNEWTADSDHERAERRTVTVRAFRYASSLVDELAHATIVVCHGGSGSVFEATAARPGCVVVVPNRSLMDDHQMELAEELQALHLVRVADAREPDTIVSAVKDALAENERAIAAGAPQRTVQEAEPRNRTAIAAIVAQELG